jgi:dolichol-phosphate mannosyltransferase
MLISVVSPVYNCTRCLPNIVRQVAASFPNRDVEWEVLFVDDRGPGEPWPVIERLAKEDPRVRGVRLTRNHGQHLAIWAGLAYARGDWVAVMDCDLQDDPSVLPTLLERAREARSDAIVVDRGSWHDSYWRRAASRAFYALLHSITGFQIGGNAGNFGIYSRRMVENLLAFRDKEVFLPAMVVMTGLDRQFYVVPRADRSEGRSSYGVKQLLRFAAALVVRFSDRPLKIGVLVGLAMSSLSALLAAVIAIAWLTGRVQVQGWTSLMLSIWFVGGLILSTLGIHGFYIGRIFSEVQERPRLRVLETVGDLPDLRRESL